MLQESSKALGEDLRSDPFAKRSRRATYRSRLLS
jgi:hypothetical protein